MAALAHGLPIVTTVPPAGAEPEPEAPRGAFPTLLDGESALLVPADDPAAASAAVVRAVTEPGRSRRLSMGAQTLSRNFAWNAIALRHQEMYSRVIAAATD
jgi:glycosyltransferase involved in cell wall biosynthesis